MAKPIHTMIRVLDESRSVAFYQAALGFEIADRYAFDDFTLVYLRSPDSTFEIELTINAA
jgi:lactoylglutathione lyase